MKKILGAMVVSACLQTPLLGGTSAELSSPSSSLPSPTTGAPTVILPATEEAKRSFSLSYTGLGPGDEHSLPLSYKQVLTFKTKKALVHILNGVTALKRAEASRRAAVTFSWTINSFAAAALPAYLLRKELHSVYEGVFTGVKNLLNNLAFKSGENSEFSVKTIFENVPLRNPALCLGMTWIVFNLGSYWLLNKAWKNFSLNQKFDHITSEAALIEVYNAQNRTEKGNVIRAIIADISKASESQHNTKLSLAFWRSAALKAALEIESGAKNLLASL